MRNRLTRTIRGVTCAICHRTIKRGEPREDMLLGDGPSTVHAACAATYRCSADELLALLDQGGAALGTRRDGW